MVAACTTVKVTLFVVRAPTTKATNILSPGITSYIRIFERVGKKERVVYNYGL